MKAITIYQPWASLIILGLKTIETRGHDRFKGLAGETIAIHSSKKPYQKRPRTDLGKARYSHLQEDVPLGVVLGTAKVEKAAWCLPSDSEFSLCQCNGMFGLWLSEAYEFREPIPARGHQGIWNWEPPEAHGKEIG